MRNRIWVVLFLFLASSVSPILSPNESPSINMNDVLLSSGRSNHDCGNNSSLTSINVSSYQSYSSTNFVQASLNSECTVSSQTYRISWSLYHDDTSSWLQVGNYSFNATQTNQGLHQYSISLANLSTGNFTLFANLSKWNSTSWEFIDQDNSTFVVTYSLPTSGCGIDVSNTMLMAYTGISKHSNEQFVAWISTYCELLYTPTWIDVSIQDTNQNLISNHTYSWTPIPNSVFSTQWLQPSLPVGNYIFESSMYTLINGSSYHVETDTTNFTVVPNPCGNNSNFTSINAQPNAQSFEVGTLFTGKIFTTCEVYNSQTKVEWFVLNVTSQSYMDAGNISWSVNYVNNTHYLNGNATYGVGEYQLNAYMYIWNSSSSSWLLQTSTARNFSFVNSSNNALSEAVDIDLNGKNYSMGDEVSASFESYNLIINETYNLQWRVVTPNQMIIDNGSVTWIAINNNSMEWKNYTIDGAPLTNGSFCFKVELYHIDANSTSTWLAGDDSCIFIGNATGGGGNETNNTDCGNELNYTSIGLLLSNYMFDDDIFYVNIQSLCNLYYTDGHIDVNLTHPNGTTTTQSYDYFTGNTSSYFFNWSVQNLVEGNYTITATLYQGWSGDYTTATLTAWYSTTFTVYSSNGNSSNGNSSNVSGDIFVDNYGYQYFPGDEISTEIKSYDLNLGITYQVNWYVSSFEANTTSDNMEGTYTWTATMDSHVEQVNFYALTAGEYCLSAVLYNYGTNFTNYLNSAYTCFYISYENNQTNSTDDFDGDGWTDQDESICGTNSNNSADYPTDFDGDGECDAIDQDDDNDGIYDSNDMCPYTLSGTAVDGTGCEKLTCPNGQIECNGTCVDLDSDVLNCGVCDNNCPQGATCENGVCSEGEVSNETDSEDEQSKPILPSLSVVGTMLSIVGGVLVISSRRKTE